MKKLTFTTIFLFLLGVAYAQITLEQTYNFSAATVKFENLGYMYYVMDVPNAQCRIYNLNHSLYKTINCNVPTGCYLADITLLSQKVFDNDEGIELAYTWYKYIPTATSYYYEYDSRIISEDGSSLVTIEGARYIYLNETEGNTWKLFAYCYDYSVWPEQVWTNIYSVPGMPVFSFSPETEKTGLKLNAFPNPSATTVKVNYTLPPGVHEATLYLFNQNGKLVNQFQADNHIDHLLIDVSKYPGGI